MRKFFRYILPLGLIALSIVVVISLVAVAKSKRPERKEAKEQVIMVDTITAEAVSLKLPVFSQGSVKPRTETTVPLFTASPMSATGCWISHIGCSLRFMALLHTIRLC